MSSERSDSEFNKSQQSSNYSAYDEMKWLGKSLYYEYLNVVILATIFVL